MNKKIILTGATGFIGQKLFARLVESGEKVTILTSNPNKAKEKLVGAIQFVQWDYSTPEKWKNYMNGQDAIIHLAGANLAARRWSKKYKRLIVESRILSTSNLVKAIERCSSKPKIFISASAVGFYGNRGEETLFEDGHPGDDFLANLCKEWEKEAEKIESQNVRRISLRIGLVLSREQGLLKKIMIPFKLFLGGYISKGLQWLPWIHIDDLIGIFIHTLNNESIVGPVNCVSPGIVRMKEFSKLLGKQLGRPSAFKVPKSLIRITLGEIADAITASQNVSAKKLELSHYNFNFPDIESALDDLLRSPNQL